MKILKSLLIFFPLIIPIKSQSLAPNNNRTLEYSTIISAIDTISEKISIKNSNDETIFELISEVGGGSICLPPITTIESGESKLYNLGNTLYWNNSPLTQSGLSNGWEIRDGNMVLSDPSMLTGIGTLSPQQKLHIENGQILVKGNSNWFPGLTIMNEIGRSVIHLRGTTNANNFSSSQLILEDIENGKIWNLLNTQTNTFTIVNHLNGTNYLSPFKIEFGASDNSLTINSNGNVGIGTWSDTYKLAVAGTIISEEVLVKLQEDWPDFVFSEDYELPSLSEQEKFILENHHLLGIPSAHSIQQSGIKVGSMQAKLMKKIEELTLYIIQQDKNIEMLTREVKYLKKSIEMIK